MEQTLQTTKGKLKLKEKERRGFRPLIPEVAGAVGTDVDVALGIGGVVY